MVPTRQPSSGHPAPAAEAKGSPPLRLSDIREVLKVDKESCASKPSLREQSHEHVRLAVLTERVELEPLTTRVIHLDAQPPYVLRFHHPDDAHTMPRRKRRCDAPAIVGLASVHKRVCARQGEGARRTVPSNSSPLFVVGSARFVSTNAVDRSTSIGSRMREANSVSVIDAGPTARVTSSEALRPRSARSGRGTAKRDNPAASVSSVKEDGPKNPIPADNRAVQPFALNNPDRRGLKNVPYSL